MNRHQFERSVETQRIVAYLSNMGVGTLVTYPELSKITATAITPSSPKMIYARKLLQEHHNAVWVAIKPAVGVRRLNSMEIAERLPKWWLKGARNKLKNGGEQADVVELKELDIDQQARFAVDCIQRELAMDALSRATRKKMEKVARGNSNDLPSFNAVEWAISLAPGRKK